MRFDWFQEVNAEVRRVCVDQCIHFYEITVGPHHVQYHVSRDGYVSKAYHKVQAERLEECVKRLEAAFKEASKDAPKRAARAPGLQVVEVAMSPGDGFWAPYLVVRVNETGIGRW